ncbi:MAG: hypothetical protein ACLFOY_16585 [Desulfatibacillaceae bacterium]
MSGFSLHFAQCLPIVADTFYLSVAPSLVVAWRIRRYHRYVADLVNRLDGRISGPEDLDLLQNWKDRARNTVSDILRCLVTLLVLLTGYLVVAEVSMHSLIVVGTHLALFALVTLAASFPVRYSEERLRSLSVDGCNADLREKYLSLVLSQLDSRIEKATEPEGLLTDG